MSGDTTEGARLYTAAGVRALDAAAIGREGIPGRVLMARAGRALHALLCARYPRARSLDVVCGTGNNGGDGFVVARLAHDAGLRVRALLVGEDARVRGEAREALTAAREAGVDIRAFDAGTPLEAELVVDALLGTGLEAEVRDAHARAIAAINAAGVPVLAADVPSGLCSDTGSVLGCAVRASHTLSFIGRKRGLYTGEAADYRGELHFDDLGTPPGIADGVECAAELLALAALLPLLGPRKRSAHKGDAGHVLVIGGNRGMAGAAAMAAESAARCGAGLVSLAVHPGSEAAILARRPELMVHAVADGHGLQPLLARASALVIGPGLGRGPWAQRLLQLAAGSGLPAVLDADALNAIAAGEVRVEAGPARVLTPHPGEAARLLGISTAEVNRDRFAALARLVGKFGCAVTLKGAGTLVGAPGAARAGVCPYGNPGMASGGMGDVLSGITGALLAQGLDPWAAARLATCLHARAADLAAAADGERGLLATDLLPWLRALLNERVPA